MAREIFLICFSTETERKQDRKKRDFGNCAPHRFDVLAFRNKWTKSENKLCLKPKEKKKKKKASEAERCGWTFLFANI
jgi:hypothetical protein